MPEVAKCPKCGETIDEAQTEAWCTKCGEPLPQEIKARLPALVRQADAAAVDSAETAHRESRSPVVNRYRDAYRVGTALVGLGAGIKIVGAVLAVIMLFGSLSAGDSQFGSGGFKVVGVFAAVVVGALFWVCGVLVAAQGEILRATLDTAVASSHFLTDSERADAMGLGRAVLVPTTD